jgi:hypothetical protein
MGIALRSIQLSLSTNLVTPRVTVSNQFQGDMAIKIILSLAVAERTFEKP